MIQVPIALVSLVDIDRQWFKSSIGLCVSETHRNDSFCAYTILPESMDVFVVSDALEDERFKNSSLVVGPPYIRFYAGAALMVAGVKVGSLCLIDTKPRHDFSTVQRMNLLDLGAAVANLIKERRDSNQRAAKDRSDVMNNLMHNIRTPLMTLGIATSTIEKDKRVIYSNLCNISETKDVAERFYNSLTDACNAMTEIKLQAANCLNMRSSCYDKLLQYEHFKLTNDIILQSNNNNKNNDDNDSNNDNDNINISTSIPIQSIENNPLCLKTSSRIIGCAEEELKSSNSTNSLDSEESFTISSKPKVKSMYVTIKLYQILTIFVFVNNIFYFICRHRKSATRKFRTHITNDDNDDTYVVAMHSSNTQPLRILLVDDSVAIQKVMRRWFESHGCVVTVAENGKVGLRLLKDNEYDITFIDFLMVSKYIYITKILLIKCK